MPILPLLENPQTYRPCIQDLLACEAGVRNYWIDLFEQHIETLARLPIGSVRLSDSRNWRDFKADYLNGLAQLRSDPRLRGGRLNVLELTLYREEKFESHGFDDPFRDLKQRENALALRILPELLHTLDNTALAGRGEQFARGLFAGNLFDMGSQATVSQFHSESFDFLAARERIKARPWPVDHLDDWLHAQRRTERPYQKCIFFVDNAGPDIILGVVPFIRDLLHSGCHVVLAANSRPALNDITAAELPALLDAISRIDESLSVALASRKLSVVASGCVSPLIDLTSLSSECCQAAGDCDLLVLEGMGRAIESNYDATFRVDTLKIALVKDRMVASLLEAQLFDPIWRFEPVNGRSN